ncbi:MAG: hypothetical protein E6Q97_20865 [Desulfurellales bacterium]|nr:MAG: hypothetical protein E6Q97_20865 [Desulfurellales bacterium]
MIEIKPHQLWRMVRGKTRVVREVLDVSRNGQVSYRKNGGKIRVCCAKTFRAWASNARVMER